MTGVSGWVRAAVCAGVTMAAGAAWLAPAALLARPQGAVPAPAPAPAELRGNAAHGRYLVERVAMCGECHSTRDQAGVIIPETRLHGGPLQVQVPWPADWPIIVPRIAGLPGYSDAEAMRLLTEGAIKRIGGQARAPMPRFRMTAEDAADVIAFLRTQ
ncbi:MAG: c-type cytochrome [Acidobacteria bacterium]|nr:c-type cytochrome [Acidobacteriota bacterium]